VETPAERREEILGGSVSYACSAASYFAPTGMVGVVGDDFPDEHTDAYRSFGIDIAGLERVPGKTFRWSGVYDADMINRKTLSTELNVFADFSPELPEPYRNAPFLLLGNISPGLQLHVLSQAAAPEFVVADTMDLWINTARDDLMDVISKVTMLTLNDSEARLLTGMYNLRACAERMLEWGPQYVVVKKGEHGAMLFSANEIFILPAYPVDEVRDPTGAGDSFAGGFMGALAAGAGKPDMQAVKKALLTGSVVASFGVEQFSLDRMKTLTSEQIAARLAELTAMISIG